MKPLGWKELRELRGPLALGAGCFVLAGALVLLQPYDAVLLALVTAAVWSAALMLGSDAVAKEPSHGTLEWQALWPASRAQWWWVKLLVHLAVLVAAFALAFGVAGLLGHWRFSILWRTGEVAPPLLPFLPFEAGVALLLFALAFLMSSLRRSSFGAFGLSLVAAVVLAGGWCLVAGRLLPLWFGPRLGISLATPRPWAVVTICATLGVVCLLAAGWATLPTPVLAFRRRRLRGGLLACALGLVALPALLGAGLYLMPAERPNFAHIDYPAVSPNRKLVAFLDDTRNMQNRVTRRLWVVGIDGTDLHCVARSPVRQFQWLPDSRRILCQWGHHAWWIVDSAGGRGRRLGLDDARQAHVSPGGRYLLAHGELIDLHTFSRVCTLPMPVGGPRPIAVPGWNFWAWARDDSAIYAVQYYVSTFPGCPGVPGTGRAAIGRFDLPYCRGMHVVYQSPKDAALLTPGGQTHWVALERSDPTATTMVDIGGGSVTVPGAMPFLWQTVSPDGRRAWLYSYKHGTATLYAVDLRPPYKVRRLPIPPGTYVGLASAPYYSPDGRWVAFAAFHSIGSVYDVYVTSADGSGRLRHLRVDGGPHTAEIPLVGWTPDDELLMSYDRLRLYKLSLDGRETPVLGVRNTAAAGRP